LCYQSDDVSTWWQIVEGAGKLNRKRLLRFSLESILYETVKGRALFNGDQVFDEDLPILPPVTYKTVQGLMKVIICWTY
jgi:hypothetical protein